MPRQAKGGPRDSLLSVRIPARLKFGLELMAKLNREPMTDVLVRALNDSLSSENGGLFVDIPGEDLPVFLMPKVWDEREAVRLVKLALVYPVLLSLDQQTLWKLIAADDRYWVRWAKAGKKSTPTRQVVDLQVDALEEDWPMLKARVAAMADKLGREPD
jgi:hypothetical protein